MQLILLPVILLAWFLASIVPAGRLAIEDELRGVPSDSRRGVSIMPIFPVLPLIIWGIGWASTVLISGIVSGVLLYSHIALAVVSGLLVLRDLIRLRRIRVANPPQVR